jgi:PleD family two-component response regulator
VPGRYGGEEFGIDAEDRDYSVWIAHADRALYAAKERGRNRSVRYAAEG